MEQIIRFATTITARVKGLLFTDSFDGWLFLCPCNDVHTYGMRFALDIVFIDRHGRVVASYQKVERSRRLRCPEAAVVIERMTCDEELPKMGDVLKLSVQPMGTTGNG